MIQNDIRESYKTFPSWCQGFLAWLTGKALPGQSPKLELSFWFYFLLPITMVIFGVLLSLLILTKNLWPYYLILSWIITLNGARSIALTIRHQCVHSVFSGNPQLDILLAEIATSIIYSQDANSYKKDHIDLHHNRKVLAGSKDSHVMALKRYGFCLNFNKYNNINIKLRLEQNDEDFYYRKYIISKFFTVDKSDDKDNAFRL